MSRDYDLDRAASEFLKENGGEIAAEPCRQKFKLGGKHLSGRDYVPLWSFLQEPQVAQPNKQGKTLICNGCGGPRSYSSGGLCAACYQAKARERFMARTHQRIAASGEVSKMVTRKYGWEGRDHMRSLVPVEDPEVEPSRVPTEVEAKFRAALENEAPQAELRRVLTDLGADDKIPPPRALATYPPLPDLAEVIARPGIDKHLVPLLHFRGRADLGRVHRLWNLLCAMKMHEVDTIGFGLAHLQFHPDAAHLCGPPKRVQRLGFQGFLSRLHVKPDVCDLQPGMRDYVRMLLPRPFALEMVTENATRQRHAWWRSFEPKMPAWRKVQGERREARALARAAERGARLEKRAEARRAREDLIQRQRAEMRWERQRRAAEREAEAQRRREEQSPRVLAYPFLIKDTGRPEHELLRLINGAVPSYLDPDLRADICQDLAVGILCGDFARDDLHLPVREVIARVRKLHPHKYGPMSLDAIIPGTDGLRLIDTI